jgi:hypothetical protein
MSAPLSNELFFQAHRGVNLSYPHYPVEGKSTQYRLDTKNFGTHWSADPEVAERFANKQSKYPDWRTNYARIIHAEIPMSSVETNTETMKQGGFANFSRQDPMNEQEVMTKEGAPVRVTGMTTLRRSKDETEIKSRKRTYNPPRKGTA